MFRGSGVNTPVWQLCVRHEWGDEKQFYTYEDERCAVLYGSNRGKLSLAIYGEIDQSIEQLEIVRSSFPQPEWTLMSTSLYVALTDDMKDYFGPSFGWGWDFYYAESELLPVPGVQRVEHLPHGSLELAAMSSQIRAVLYESNPLSEAHSFFESLSWFILRENDTIVAVVGYDTFAEHAYLHGLGTKPAYRGKGYAAAIMVGAINQLLSSLETVQFTMWAWNNPARKLYERIGMTHGASLIHGRREPFVELG
ncbi:Acetyltransferase (GNAT) family protein [Arcanobacterium phocae]|uniref:Acetyltransferase (GNAT) family protein n=2 Tax=Arcanobacterium phocae TaxID=131112 RepID=A0A1H2LJV7_9ACTO|nr:Acetyltransferase (GNAT) family protein [Arcanobacterium phocae]